MSLLNTFAILFETDAGDARDEIDSLSDALDNAEDSSTGAADGLDDVADTADSGSLALGGLTRSLLGLVAAYVTFDAVASGVIENALAIDAVGKFSQVIGENIVEMDAWGAAAARNGGSAEAFRGSVESLNTSLADIKISGGGEVVNTLAMIGVRATSAGGHVRSAFDILPQLADSFQRMSASQSFSFGRKLGLDQGTILLLQQGRNAVDELVQRQKMLGGVTKEGYEIAAVFNDQWDDTKRMFNGLWMSANTTILPALTQILKSLENLVMWMRQNQDLVEGFFVGAASAAGIYAGAIVTAKIATFGLANAVKFLGKATGIGLLIAGFAILYEDLKKWANGGESLIGKMLGPFEDFKKSMLEIFDVISQKWEDFITFFKESGQAIEGFFDWFGGDDEEKNDKVKRANSFNPSWGNSPQSDQDPVINWSGGDNEDKDEEKNDKVKRDNSPVPVWSNSPQSDQAQKMVYSYNQNPLNNSGSGYYSNKQNTTTNNVTVAGAKIDARGMSPEQASQVVNTNMTGQIERALGQLDNGVDR